MEIFAFSFFILVSTLILIVGIYIAYIYAHRELEYIDGTKICDDILMLSDEDFLFVKDCPHYKWIVSVKKYSNLQIECDYRYEDTYIFMEIEPYHYIIYVIDEIRSKKLYEKIKDIFGIN